MLAANVPGLLALLFILAMVWLRTRLHYPRSPGQRLRLTRSGVGYFGALVCLLAVGWLVAPALAQHFGLAPTLSASLAQTVWFVVVYATFIAVHRALKARDIAVFSTSVA